MSARIRKGYVDTSAGQIHYREAGNGLPLVLLHQSPSSSAMWERLLPALGQRGVRAVAFDFPGFGTSDKPASAPSMSWYAGVMVEAAAGLGLDHFNVLGHHTGVSMALVMADEHPERVLRLLLWGVPMLPEAGMSRLANEGPATFSADGHEVAEYFVRRGKMSGSAWSVDLAIRCLIEKLQLGRDSNWAHNAVGRIDHESLVKRVTAPTLVMCSEGDGIVWQASKEAAALLPNGRYLDFPGTSLDVADEQPEALADAVFSFIRN